MVKCGAAGAVWAGAGGATIEAAGATIEAGGATIEAAAPPTAVVDPTGAGDAFAAGLLAAWVAGAEPDAALAEGVRLGALAVGRLGARPPA